MVASSKLVATVRIGDGNAKKTNGYSDEKQVKHNEGLVGCVGLLQLSIAETFGYFVGLGASFRQTS